MSLSKSDVLAIYGRALAKAKSAVDSKGNTNADALGVAFHATRSEVHEALQARDAVPGPHPDDDGDPDLLQARQKAHGKKLWKQTDALIVSAGLTEKGTN